jgi:hypothetical protein
MSDREAFEHWYADHTGDAHIRKYCDSTGRYQFNAMQSSWEAWKAAQAQAELDIIYDDNGCPTEVRIAQDQAVNQQLLEALQLANAALSGSNMNMKAVENKVKAAIAAAQEQGK